MNWFGKAPTYSCPKINLEILKLAIQIEERKFGPINVLDVINNAEKLREFLNG